MIVAADYINPTKVRSAELHIYTIVDNRRGSVLKSVLVGGKREARKIAIAEGATPWNF